VQRGGTRRPPGHSVGEQCRRHAELTPQFEIACIVGESGIGDHGELSVTLTGPPGLDKLDEVTIVILDESGADHWGHGYPTGVGEAEARGFVWGR
jgi:hypothetical protein